MALLRQRPPGDLLRGREASVSAMTWVLLTIFCLTYAGISARRLQILHVGRPAAALIGACAMIVAAGFGENVTFTPEKAMHAVEPNTVGLLLGMMIVSAGLGLSGFFDWAANVIGRRFPSPVALLYAITVGCGLLSALLVNDAVCLLGTPLVVRLAARARVSPAPYLLGTAMGANAGSAMTLGGNPQNMLVAKLSGLSYRGYLAVAGPAGLVALFVTAAVIHALFLRKLHIEEPASASREAGAIEQAERDPALLYTSLGALGCVLVANLLGANLAVSALSGGAIALAGARRRAHALFERVDWTVLVFFGSLFVVVAGLKDTGLVDQVLAAVERAVPPSGVQGWGALTGVLLGGSQIVSNVPLILLLEPYIRSFDNAALAWTLTALVSTLAGNLTLLGSVANIIVLEQAGPKHRIGFVEYARVGVPVTLLSLGASALLLWLLGGWL